MTTSPLWHALGADVADVIFCCAIRGIPVTESFECDIAGHRVAGEPVGQVSVQMPTPRVEAEQSDWKGTRAWVWPMMMATVGCRRPIRLISRRFSVILLIALSVAPSPRSLPLLHCVFRVIRVLVAV